ncbi:MAG: adenine phosphoribosyltransferase [Pseudomonadota bacterium]
MSTDLLRQLIRDVPDFPKPGVVYKDITPLLADPAGFRTAVELMAAPLATVKPRALLAIESRGFLFGAALAHHMNLPLHLIRKHGKLPWRTVGVTYTLEYGTDRIEVHTDAIEADAPYAIVDDVLATGGTAAAAVDLVQQQKGKVAACAFLIELDFLNGRERLAGQQIQSLLHY